MTMYDRGKLKKAELGLMNGPHLTVLTYFKCKDVFAQSSI